MDDIWKPAVAGATVLAIVIAAASMAPMLGVPVGDAGPSRDGPDPPDDEPEDPPADSASLLVRLERVDPPTEVRAYPVFGSDGAPHGNRSWRVVEGTGNAAENHVTTTERGRIVDLGGMFPLTSLDEGRTWTRVAPETPYVATAGEGAVAAAPNGDVVAVVYGLFVDRLVSFKWDASSGQWAYAESPVKTPFFDRPWMAVVPGPVTFAGQTWEYAVYLRGGYPKEVGYVSYDGLHYVEPDWPTVEARAGGTTPGPATLEPRPWMDWVQPHTKSGITPLPGGGAVVQVLQSIEDEACRWKHLAPDMTWSCLDLPGLRRGRLLVDTEGRLHNVIVDASTVTYRISSDVGRHWTETTHDLPDGYEVRDGADVTPRWDFKTSAALNTTILAVRAHHPEMETEQDMVLRFNVTTDRARLVRRYHVGAGDLATGFGIVGTVEGEPRFDWTTLGFLPDGRFVVSFADRDHHPPSLAVLLDGG